MQATQAAADIADHTGVSEHRVAVILGSGWQDAATRIGEARAKIPMAELPGFVTPTAEGHVGTILSVDVAGIPTLLVMGRNHLYEGYEPSQVVHQIRTAVAAGAAMVNDVSGLDFDPGSNVVDVYVRYLRGKLGPDHIVTVRGAGYRWE